jgi:DNA-binding MarR family transcriptional regulator
LNGATAVAQRAVFRHLSRPRVAAANASGLALRPGRQTMTSSSSVQSAKAENKTDADEPAEKPLIQLEGFLPHRLNVLSSLVSQALTQVYSKYGIGIPEWRVLVTLGQWGVMTGKAIGARTHMHKTKVSRAVAQLEARKFVTRKANRADLREAFLSLTPAGRAVFEELAPRARDFTEKLSEVVSPADRAAFDRAVSQLTQRSAELVAKDERER